MRSCIVSTDDRNGRKTRPTEDRRPYAAAVAELIVES